jgi:hypothetical protein
MKKLYKIEYTGTVMVYIDENFALEMLNASDDLIRKFWCDGQDVVGYNGINNICKVSTVEDIPTLWVKSIPLGETKKSCEDIVNDYSI